MKNHLTTLLLLITLLAFGACRNKCCDVNPQTDFINAEKDGKQWITTTHGAGFYQDSLYISGSVGSQYLSMHIKFTGTGKYVLTGKQVGYMLLLGGDGLMAQYYADPTAESVLNIGAYDEENKIISGSFNLNIARNYPNDDYYTPYAKKLTFTKGLFKVAISK